MIDGIFKKEHIQYDDGHVKIITSTGSYAQWHEVFIDGAKVWEDGYIE